MRGGHAEHVVGFAARCLLAMVAPAVPAGRAALLVAGGGLQRHVIAAEHGIGAIGEAVQRLRARHRIGNGGEVHRRVERAVVEVEAAAALERIGRRRFPFGQTRR